MSVTANNNQLSFDLQIYFINPTILLTAVDEQVKARIQNTLERVSKLDEPLSNALLQSTFSNETKRFVITNKVPPLEELLVTGESLDNRYITLERPFYFKGLPKAIADKSEDPTKRYAEFRARLDEYPELIVGGKFDVDKITTNTALTRLSGQSKVFMLAYVVKLAPDHLDLRPIVIADKVQTTKPVNLLPVQGSLFLRYPEQIDEFRKIEEVTAQAINMKDLKRYPEIQVKQWFAEIIGEAFLPKDWGGEQSDLYTAHLHVDGRRLRGAFIFKGPSHFGPMKNNDLGKNGDQIVRLFQEPADIYILQHCHFVSTAVRHTMEAFASRFYQPRLYAILDGSDTLRILKAYAKV